MIFPTDSTGSPRLTAIENGWLVGARQVPSPNANERPIAMTPSVLVIHNISLPPGVFGGNAIEAFFSNTLDTRAHPYFETIAQLKVSAHLLIRRCGELVQFVSFDRRAWHAGRSCFQGQSECNDFSIGIELEGTDDIPYSHQQYQALVQVSRSLLAHYPKLNAERIVGHSDIAPGRKTDPGAVFDWPGYLSQLGGES